MRVAQPLLWLTGAALVTACSLMPASATASALAGVADVYAVNVDPHLALPFGFVFLVFAAFYAVAPKLSGRGYSARLATVHFGVTVAGAALIFAPRFVPFPRRVVDGPEQFAVLNAVSTTGYFVSMLGLVVFLIVLTTMFTRPKQVQA